jgi:tetratricopeptide (TPR) repeat protein
MCAVGAQEDGYALLQRERLDAALAALARADSLERDPRKVVFHAADAGLMAFAYAASGRYDEARREASRALAIYPHNRNARIVLAADAERMNRLEEAEAHLDTLQAVDPYDAKAVAMRGEIAALRRLLGGTGQRAR